MNKSKTVTIPESEYNALLTSKMKYEYLQQLLSADLFSPPPTKDIDTVAEAFEQTGKYNKSFITSLKKRPEKVFAF